MSFRIANRRNIIVTLVATSCISPDAQIDDPQACVVALVMGADSTHALTLREGEIVQAAVAPALGRDEAVRFSIAISAAYVAEHPGEQMPGVAARLRGYRESLRRHRGQPPMATVVPGPCWRGSFETIATDHTRQ